MPHISRDSRPRSGKPPAYQYHVSGSARVTIQYTDYLLGEYGSRDSRKLYALLIAEYDKLDKAPDKEWFKKKKAKLERRRLRKQAKGETAKDILTVAAVTTVFRQRIREIYSTQAAEYNRYKNLCDLLDYEYGDLSVDQFRPTQLKEIRAHFVLSGNNRRYVNDQTNRVKKIFRYAATEGDLIEREVYERLEYVAAVRRGQKVAEANGQVPPESKKTPVVELAVIRKTAEQLSPTLRAMIVIQVNTGMRPSEIFNMTPGEIDRSGDVWIYRPDSHKTAHLGIEKQVPILGEARLAVEPFLDRPSDKPCFSPSESKAWYLAQRHARRKTPLGQGDYPGSKSKRCDQRIPRRQPGEKWKKGSHNRAIRRACEKAGVTRWTPYSLRHTIATLVKEGLSAEHVQALLNHKHIKTQDIYARNSLNKAIEAARMTPEIGPFV